MVGAGAAVAAALVAGAIAFAWEARIAGEQRDDAVSARLAESARAEGERAAKLVAERRLGQVEKASRILGAIFKSLDPKEIAVAQRPLQAILVEQLDKAIPLFEQALKGYEKQLGRAHAKTRATVANLAVNYLAAGRAAEARPLLEEAYAAIKENPELVFVAPVLLDVYEATGEHAKAAAMIEDALVGARAQLPADSPDLAALLARLTQCRLALKQWDQAAKACRESLDIRQKLQPDGWPTFNSQSLLGAALTGQGKWAEAEPLLIAGCEGLQQRAANMPSVAAARVPEAGERLVQFYAAWELAEPGKGHAAKGAEWKARLETLRRSPKGGK